MSLILSTWNLPPSIIDRCDRYYILHWDGKYFSDLFYKSSGRITREGVDYQIIFYGSIARELLSADRVAVSFRRFNGDKTGFALVKEYK